MNRELTKKRAFDINWKTYTMIFALIAIMVFFQIITDGIFFNSRNLSNLTRQMSITGVIAVAVVLLIISGNFDLAVGSIVGLTSGVAAILQVNYGWDTVPVIIVAIVIGIMIGIWQGFWVAFKKVPSFIVTLGGMLMFRGIYLVMTNGITITPLKEDFAYISQGFVPKEVGLVIGAIAICGILAATLNARNSRKRYSLKLAPLGVDIAKIIGFSALVLIFILILNNYNGIPIPVLIFLLLVLVFSFIGSRTRFGRSVYAIGGNQEAARLSGINVEKNTLLLFILTGMMAAVSGVLLTSRLDGATASAGESYEMDVISACVLGGTSLAGGKGTISGAVIGTLIIASLDNGMSLMNLSYNYQSIVKGLVLILAVWFDVANQRKK